MMITPMSQNDSGNDLLMLQSYMYSLHYNNNSLLHTHARYCVHDNIKPSKMSLSEQRL